MEAVFEIILLFTLAKFTILKIQYIQETILMVHFRGTCMHVIVIENAFEIEQSKEIQMERRRIRVLHINSTHVLLLLCF
jgi:hypothetical protein